MKVGRCIYKEIMLITLISLTFILLFFSENVTAIEYFFIGGRPAHPDPDIPNSASWFIYELEPGEQIEDELIVINSYTSDLDILVYAADGIKSSGGGFAVKQYVEPKEHVGAWVRFYPDEVPDTLARQFSQNNNSIIEFCSASLDEIYPEEVQKQFQGWCEGKENVTLETKQNSEQLLKFVFSVPEDAEIGEHTGGIMIQKIDTDDETGTQGLTLTTRVGIRLYETVPGDIIRKLRISSLSVRKIFDEFDIRRIVGRSPDSKDVLISTTIENLGNVSVQFEESITITQTFPVNKIQKVPTRTFQVLRDDTFLSNFTREDTPYGRYVIVNLIEYEDSSGKIISRTSEPVILWIIPWEAISLLTTIPIVLYALLIKRRIAKKKRRRRLRRPWDSGRNHIVTSFKKIKRKLKGNIRTWKKHVKKVISKPPIQKTRKSKSSK